MKFWILLVLSAIPLIVETTACAGEADASAERYARAALRSGLSPLSKSAYEQLANVRRGKFIIQLGRTSLVPDRERPKPPPDDALDRLYAMGVDILPILAEALDDTTPSQTFKYDTHTVLQVRVGEWKVNELVGALICTIADRDFVLVQNRVRYDILELNHSSGLIPRFQKLVLDWYSENAKRTPLERRMAALRDDIPQNRVAAVAWIGWRREKAGRDAVVHFAKGILAEERGIAQRTRELSESALALASLGDPRDVALVRRICTDLSAYVAKTGFPAFGFKPFDLLRAYRGFALVIGKQEALRCLEELRSRSSPNWRDSERSDYDLCLADARKRW
jgi:hypothetical protein